MKRGDNESAADWHARVLHDLEAALAEEDRHRHRRRLRDPAGLILLLDNADMDARRPRRAGAVCGVSSREGTERERLIQEERQLRRPSNNN